jgi:hypothetical protein
VDFQQALKSASDELNLAWTAVPETLRLPQDLPQLRRRFHGTNRQNFGRHAHWDSMLLRQMPA